MITAGNRFGSNNSYFASLETSMIPYPRINFMTSSFAPWEYTPTAAKEFPSVSEITEDLFKCSNSLISTSNQESKIIATNISYFGDVQTEDIKSSVENFRNSELNTFCDATNKGIGTTKVELGEGCTRFSNKITDTLYNMKRSACILMSSQRAIEILERVSKTFDKLYHSRAYVFTYVGVGFESGEFSECRECHAATIKDYEELGITISEGDDDSFD